MAKPLVRSGRLLVVSAVATALLQPTFAQTPPPADESADPAAQVAGDDIEIVGPGMTTLTVTGTRDRNIQKANSEVVSVLSNEDIARTGEGDIAGALSRVTGLSVVGGGFVYVRGLGDRYSQALLNGSQLPSPEPLRRAIPLDLFPTDVIASSLVQKTYSPNFPGEFGGGVINLTTLAIPETSFIKGEFGVSGDTETTGQVGYTYYGDRRDWSGYDQGNRNLSAPLWSFLNGRQRLSSGLIDTGALAKTFVTPNNALVQRNPKIPANISTSVTGGDAWMIGDSKLGLVGTVGFSNKWRTRDNIEQTPANFDLSQVDKDYHTVSTEDRAVANAMLGIGYEFGEGQRIRWTNLYIHDTVKRTGLSEGKQNNQHLGQDFLEQNTAWYARQLFDTQLASSFTFEPFKLNARASYATSKREAPYELGLGYVRTNQSASPYGGYFVNRLDNGQTGFAKIAFSTLAEDLKSAGVDGSWQIVPTMAVSLGLDWTDTQRDSMRREFQFIAPSTFPNGVAMLRPDLLLGSAVIDYYRIRLIETTETDPAFAAELETKAAFAQLLAELTDGLELNIGTRFERGEQQVNAVQVFDTGNPNNASTHLRNDYWLPAATLTYKFGDNMQLRVNGSRTVARPQFRELIFQSFYDPENNRVYRGNPLLVDSKFTNAEARWEWYFEPEQRLAVAGFWKKIDRPIEAYTGFNDNTPVTSYANAPQATLKGAEFEMQKYFPLEAWFQNDLLATRRGVLITNYTYTTSKIDVGANDTVRVFGTAVQPASNFFRDGGSLTGQSNHLANVQFGIENPDNLSQRTFLIGYQSKRVTSRGPAGLPDLYEQPGLTVDFIARQGFELLGHAAELKVEARNLFRNGYKEYQERGANRVYFNRYDVGTSYGASFSMTF